MSVELFDHQEKALRKLKVGSILRGGTGSGKSLTALAFYISVVCEGVADNDLYLLKNPKDLYIITTAKKRDSKEWEKECSRFLLSTNEDENPNGVKVVIDSWNNIQKYTSIIGAFFIFDEQRVVGSGSWVKSFLRITKVNKWILLTATPGDKWLDYIPVFVANGFYKNRTEFIRRHVVYNSFVKFPQVSRYVETGRLIKLKNDILVDMEYIQDRVVHNEVIFADFDKELMQFVVDYRKNPYNDNQPIKNSSEYFYVARQIVNSDKSRAQKVKEIIKEHPKIIIFYNFDYELKILKELCKEINVLVAEWNGHKHQPLPTEAKTWVYLVQYSAGAEGWNCIETNAIIFYSQNYSYRMLVQAAGRINRLNSPYKDLYYYKIRSRSWIDQSIARMLDQKRNFNEPKIDLQKKHRL